MTGITALLLFAAWTLVVMMIYVGYRVALVLTLKKPANAGSGALASTSARSIDGRTSSARSAGCRVTTLAVAGTPVVSAC